MPLIEFKTSFTKKRTLLFEGDLITYGDQSLIASNVTGFSYGKSFTEVRFVKFWRFHFRIQDSIGREIKAEFSDTLNSYFDDLARSISMTMWQSFGNRLLDQSITKILCGQIVDIGGLKVDRTGFTYTYKPWFRKERTEHENWEDVVWEHAQPFDLIFLKSKRTKKAFAAMGFAAVLNAHILSAIVKEYQKNSQFRDQLKNTTQQT